MKQMDELINGLTEKLENQLQSTGTAENMPRVPLMILYMGDQAYCAKEDITVTLRQVWRKRTDAVEQMIIKNGKFYQYSDGGQQEELSIKVFQSKVDALYAHEKSFSDMKNFFLVMIFDTKDYENAESFKRAYESVTEIQQYANFPYCLSMSIIFIDESATGSDFGKKIRQYLREKLEQKTLSFRSTFLLSNRLYSGVLLNGERKRENYDLAGTIILLSNSYSVNYRPPVSLLFPAENEAYYLTAAFSRVRKPNRKICEIILNRVLKWCNACLRDGTLLSLEELCIRLGITGGSAKLISEFYNHEVRPNLPEKEALEYLPRASKNMEQLSTKPYHVFKQETMGCAKIFYQQEFALRITESAEKFAPEFQKYLSKKIKTGEALKITDVMIDNVVQQLSKAYPLDNTPAYQYMIERAEADFIKQVLPAVIEGLKNLRNTAKDYVLKLQDLSNEFQQGFFIDPEEENIRHYYDRLAEDFLSGQNGEKIKAKLMDMDGTRECLIEFLKDTMDVILSSNPIFAAPLVEEMTLRMGADPVEIQQTIKNELLNEIGEKMRLQTLTSLPMLREIFIVSQKDASENETMFFKYLQELRQDQVNVDFFDSRDNNSIEVLRLYRCDANLLV